MDEFSDGKAIFLKPDAIQYDKDGNEMAHWRFDVPAPKREWVGLTKEEVDSWELPDCPTVFEFVQFIEAKIKEKNT